ncbi:uncharacterized protein E5676_scaffold5066G00120 [Cucumis melo var. makuwa]|uniref:Uncharacterized protein n=1 Tax=Cucumis melo var. makuwa TaxID=1194695 RepID=A0A5A7U1L0_CUCMM|nr:uncharacterized protein E6C27_scaffold163G001370 [Cucumis melo var. makuwa]TYK18511.1 uncharacterized protein E5676_scaffold5066G00120 [Cucumis melo var. makuwa]
MSLLIPDPRSPDKEIDVYLQPLIEELKVLWTFGVRTYDSLTGWSTKEYQACPICMGDRSSFGIRGRISLMGHRHYLLENHVWRRSRLHDEKVEHRARPVDSKRMIVMFYYMTATHWYPSILIEERVHCSKGLGWGSKPKAHNTMSASSSMMSCSQSTTEREIQIQAKLDQALKQIEFQDRNFQALALEMEEMRKLIHDMTQAQQGPPHDS